MQYHVNIMPVCNTSTKRDSNYKLEIMAFTICPVGDYVPNKKKVKEGREKKLQ